MPANVSLKKLFIWFIPLMFLAACGSQNQSYQSLEEALKTPLLVKELTLSKTELTELSPNIGQLKQLEVLRLGDNNLTTLPPEIGQLTNLKVLRLGYNKLTSLPEEIGQLTNLQELRIGYNQLERLPASIKQLSQLKRLHIGYNPLSQLPPELTALKNLEHLGCNGTNIPTAALQDLQQQLPNTKVKFQ